MPQMSYVDVIQKAIWDAKMAATVIVERQDPFRDPALEPKIYSRQFDEPTPSFFQVEIQPDDDLFLKQLDKHEAPWRKQHKYRMEVLVKDEVAWFLSSYPTLGPFFKSFREVSQAANDYRFYHSAIQAAATLFRMLYTTECLYKRARYRSLDDQLNELWEQISVLGRKGCPVDDLCNSIVLHKIVNNNFSLVTEADIAELLSWYEQALTYTRCFKTPFKAPRPGRKKNAVYYDIKGVICKTKFHTRWKVDEYTHILIKFARRDAEKEENLLLEQFMRMVDTNALPKPDPKLLPSFYEVEPSGKDIMQELKYLLLNLIDLVNSRVTKQVLKVMWPLFKLTKPVSVLVSADVQEIIEVAELRRIALGSRFLSRNHFMWAFYECGYGLPPKIRKTIKLNIANEDHPPYHIYVASIKLAESLGEKEMRVEHFVFAVLYSKVSGNDGKQVVQKVLKMQEHFKDFLKEVASDCVKRPNVKGQSWLKPYLHLFDVEDEPKEEIWSSKVGDFVHEHSSRIS